jgi:hypothetical protein
MIRHAKGKSLPKINYSSGSKNRSFSGLASQKKSVSVSPSAGFGRKAASVTEYLCGLYIMATMNMDPSLILFYVQSGALKKWLKKNLAKLKRLRDG